VEVEVGVMLVWLDTTMTRLIAAVVAAADYNTFDAVDDCRVYYGQYQYSRRQETL
jgi:hypothetical protein